MRHLALCMGIAVACLGIAGCGAMTASRATLAEAKAVVEVVYGQLPDAAVDRLPYTAGPISPTVKRLRARLPDLRPWFEAGLIGIAANGLIRIRTLDDLPRERQDAIRVLVQKENRDRLILYDAHTEEVGHGNDMFGDIWSAYEGASFAAEWVAGAPAGWWYQDDRRLWWQKKIAPAKPEPDRKG